MKSPASRFEQFFSLHKRRVNDAQFAVNILHASIGSVFDPLGSLPGPLIHLLLAVLNILTGEVLLRSFFGLADIVARIALKKLFVWLLGESPSSQVRCLLNSARLRVGVTPAHSDGHPLVGQPTISDARL